MKRDHLLTVEKIAGEPDQFADEEPSWEEVRQEWFDLRPLSGEEFQRARQMQAQTSHEGKCAYFPGALPTMRLTEGDRTFHVESVVNVDEKNRDLVWRLVEVS